MEETLPLSGTTFGPYDGARPKQLIIMLHGPDTPPESMAGFAKALEPHFPHARFLAPEAPFARPAHPDSRFWIRHQENSNAALLDGLRYVAPRIDNLIDNALADDGLPSQALALVGFSEGALVALHVGLRRSHEVAGILCFSGCLVGPAELKSEITAHPPVYLIQGDNDPGLPTHVLSDSIADLMRAGVHADSHVCPGMGHSINKEAVNRGAKFLTRIFHIHRNPPAKKKDGAEAGESVHRSLLGRILHPHARRAV